MKNLFAKFFGLKRQPPKVENMEIGFSWDYENYCRQLTMTSTYLKLKTYKQTLEGNNNAAS